MGARPGRYRFEFQGQALERRDLPTGVPTLIGPGIFHHDGIDGTTLDKGFIDLMNARLNNSKQVVHRIFEAFQVFSQSAIGTGGTAPASPVSGATLGNPPVPATLANFTAAMQVQVASALSTYEILSSQVRPSIASGPKFTPRAQQSLIPFAQAQIARMEATIAALPAGGTGDVAAATAAINTAYNAILNSVAEYSLHPNLFPSSGEFYINTSVVFTTDFDGTPATQGSGYFIRGAGGAILPGATLHPHLPGGG